MKPKTVLFFTVFFLSVLYFSAAASADMIEIKGKGVITGTIIAEDDNSVTFKDDYGNTAVHPRADVLFLEKQSKSKPSSAPKHSSASSSAKGKDKGKDAAGSRGFDIPFQEEITGVTEKVSQNGYEYLTEDPEAMKEALQSIAADPKQIQKKIEGVFQGEHKGLAYAGLALLIVGMLGAVVFGFKVMWLAFGESFWWGFVFLSNGLAVFAAYIGPSIGVILLLPHLLSLYFIFSNWPLVRKCVVGQLLCLDIVVLGALLMKMAF